MQDFWCVLAAIEVSLAAVAGREFFQIHRCTGPSWEARIAEE
jgi:hypothetical protein